MMYNREILKLQMEGWSLQSQHRMPMTSMRHEGKFSNIRKRQNKKQKLFASTSENASDPDQDPVPSAELDWRKFRANLIASERRQEKVDAQSGETQNVSSARKQEDLSNEDDDDVWAHQISAPETGCILFARQSIGNIGFFTNSVILMVRHENSRGSSGLLLGRTENRENHPLAQVFSMFSDQKSFFPHPKCGGPVNRSSVLILHGPPALNHSEELFKDIHVGGWPSVMEDFLQSSKTKTEEDMFPEMCFFIGSCGWAPHQLENEERMGTWIAVSASPKLIRSILYGDMSEEEIRGLFRKVTDIEDL